MPAEERETIIRMAKDGCSDRQIAEAVYYAPRHIERIRVAEGIRRQRGRKKISQRKVDRIISLYLQGLKLSAIAESVHVGINTASLYTRKWRIENET